MVVEVDHHNYNVGLFQPEIFMTEELTAFHEAGHAYAAIYVGARVQSVTIDPDNDDGPKRTGDTVILWNRRRPLPPYAMAFCEMLAEHVRKVFPITRPTEAKAESRTRAKGG